MLKNIDLFYTGGGITIAETDLNKDHYAVVSSEAPEFLTVYAYSEEEKTYLPDDMLFSHHREEIAPDLKALYAKMLEKLQTA